MSRSGPDLMRTQLRVFGMVVVARCTFRRNGRILLYQSRRNQARVHKGGNGRWTVSLCKWDPERRRWQNVSGKTGIKRFRLATHHAREWVRQTVGKA